MIRIAKALGAIVLLAVSASGCAVVADVAANSALVAMVDQSVSDQTGKQCRLADFIRGDALCRVPAPPLRARPPVYCFQTLGGVDCYSERDPFGLNEAPRTIAPLPLNDPTPAMAQRLRPAPSEELPPRPTDPDPSPSATAPDAQPPLTAELAPPRPLR